MRIDLAMLEPRQLTPAVQRQLEVSQPNDPEELQAERVADEVMGMSEPAGVCPDCPDAGGAADHTAERISEGELPDEDELEQLGGSMAPARVQRSGCAECEEEEMLGRSALPSRAIPRDTMGSNTQRVSPEVESEIRALHGGGSPLSDETLGFMEPRFGYDFSRVRVHTGERPAKLARQLEARAFTVGNDVVFGAGEYQPATHEGRHILAHELTHVA